MSAKINFGKKYRLIAGVLLFGIILVVGQYSLVYATDDSIDVTVTVTEPANESYGANVIGSDQVWLPWRALGEPDRRGALIFRRGWVTIELENTVVDSTRVSIWAARWGWKPPHFKVYASADGSDWQYIGNGKCQSVRYTRFDFNGNFGDVRYIKVERNQMWAWSTMALDAVWVKGGDA